MLDILVGTEKPLVLLLGPDKLNTTSGQSSIEASRSTATHDGLLKARYLAAMSVYKALRGGRSRLCCPTDTAYRRQESLCGCCVLAPVASRRVEAENPRPPWRWYDTRHVRNLLPLFQNLGWRHCPLGGHLTHYVHWLCQGTKSCLLIHTPHVFVLSPLCCGPSL